MKVNIGCELCKRKAAQRIVTRPKDKELPIRAYFLCDRHRKEVIPQLGPELGREVMYIQDLREAEV